MSICLMTRVWKQSPSKGGDLLLLLAIADYADDQDTAYPSIPTLAKKARMTERGVQKGLKRLEKSGQLVIEPGAGPHGVHLYHVTIPEGVNNVRGEQRSGVNSETQTGEQSSPKPSGDPSKNPDLAFRARETIDDVRIAFDNADGNDPATVPADVSAVAGVSTDATAQTPEHEGPTPAPGVPDPLAAAFAPPDSALDEVARAVLAYLNQATGRQYGEVMLEPALRGIKACLTAGATHDDCYLVIDFCKNVLDVEMEGFAEQYLDTETPWDLQKFVKYRARAKKWDQHGRPPATPRATREPGRARRHVTVISNGVLSNPRTRANVEAAQRGMARIEAQWYKEDNGHEA